MNSSIIKQVWALQICLLIFVLVACTQPENEVAETAVPATVTPQIAPTSVDSSDSNFIVIATDAPNPPYTEFDEFGEIIGFSALALAEIAANAGIQYELVVTPNEGGA